MGVEENKEQRTSRHCRPATAPQFQPQPPCHGPAAGLHRSTMKLFALLILISAALIDTSAAQEQNAKQRDQEFRRHIAQTLKERAIKALQESQQIAVCEPRKGVGQVIRKVLKGEFGLDSVGQLKVGQLWNSSGFPSQRILVFERFELGGIGGSTDISSTRFFTIDDEGRILISKERAVYLSIEELIRILDEHKKSNKS